MPAVVRSKVMVLLLLIHHHLLMLPCLCGFLFQIKNHLAEERERERGGERERAVSFTLIMFLLPCVQYGGLVCINTVLPEYWLMGIQYERG